MTVRASSSDAGMDVLGCVGAPHWLGGVLVGWLVGGVTRSVCACTQHAVRR
jgi:hypothetical protein